MATNGVPRLALEVLELIVGNIDSGHKKEASKDLRACLSVSREFRHCALRRLYHDVCLTNAQNNRRLLELWDLVSPPPGSPLEGVGRYIKSMSVLYTSDYYGPYSPGSPINMVRLNQFLSANAMTSLMDPIHVQLCEFNLSMKVGFRSYHHCEGIQWGNLTPAFHGAFQTLIQSPYLTSLNLLNLTSIPRTLLIDAQLKDLKLTRCFEDPNAPLPFHSGDYPLLETLSTDHSYRLHMTSNSINRLRNLITSNSKFADSVQTWAMMKSARNTLERINIVQRCDLEHSLTSLTLDTIVNVKSISYSHRHFPSQIDHPNFSTLLHLFDLQSPATKLESFELVVAYAGREAPQSREDVIAQVTDPRWTLLDGMLTGGQFPSLRHVTITFSIFALAMWDDMDMDSMAIENDMRTVLVPFFPVLVGSPAILSDLKMRVHVERLGEP